MEEQNNAAAKMQHNKVIYFNHVLNGQDKRDHMYRGMKKEEYHNYFDTLYNYI